MPLFTFFRFHKQMLKINRYYNITHIVIYIFVTILCALHGFIPESHNSSDL